jgi:DNA-damage-inducible protein J
MPQTSINIRTDENLKKQFDSLCEELGLNITTAFNIFMKDSVRNRRIPVDLSLKASVPKPRGLDDLTKAEFDAKLEKAWASAEAGNVRPANAVFADLERDILNGTI